MDLDRARALAASDAPVSSDTMGRAQLVVLLAVLDALRSDRSASPHVAAGDPVEVFDSSWVLSFAGVVRGVGAKHILVTDSKDLTRAVDPDRVVKVAPAQAPQQPQPAQAAHRKPR